MVSNLLFYSIFIVGLLTVILSKSFMWMWLSMELISLSVAIFILVNSSVSEMSGKKSTLLLKYLMVQFVAGSMVLSSSFMMVEWWHILMVLALSLKLGLVPLHSWVIDIFSSMSLMECFILSVVSKISPLLILLHWAPEWAFLLGVISILSGSFMGIMFSDLRHILSCSSIISTSWLCMAASFSAPLFIYSFIFYSFSNFVLFWALDKSSTYSLSDSMMNLIPSYKMKMLVSLILMGNVSLPIFLFFMVKMLVIIETKWYFLMLLVLIFSSISIVWYARVINVIWSYESGAFLLWQTTSLSSLFFTFFVLSSISGIMLIIYLIY